MALISQNSAWRYSFYGKQTPISIYFKMGFAKKCFGFSNTTKLLGKAQNFDSTFVICQRDWILIVA